MIIRIVQMSFRVEEVPVFLELFEARKERIRNFEGCTHLELWNDPRHPEIYFTYSHWDTESALDHYRFSDFFKETWGLTKALFEKKPQAWSLVQHTTVN